MYVCVHGDIKEIRLTFSSRPEQRHVPKRPGGQQDHKLSKTYRTIIKSR